MSDASPPPPPPSATPPPDIINFNQKLLEQWIALPPNRRIVAELTRQEIDFLLFGLLRTSEAITALQNALVQYSNGQTENANRELGESRRLVVDGQNNIRQFFTGIMLSTTKDV